MVADEHEAVLAIDLDHLVNDGKDDRPAHGRRKPPEVDDETVARSPHDTDPARNVPMTTTIEFLPRTEERTEAFMEIHYASGPEFLHPVHECLAGCDTWAENHHTRHQSKKARSALVTLLLHLQQVFDVLQPRGIWTAVVFCGRVLPTSSRHLHEMLA
jgi:hypothetical protein